MSNTSTCNSLSLIVAATFIGIGLLMVFVYRNPHPHHHSQTPLDQFAERVESPDIQNLWHLLYYNGKTPTVTHSFTSSLRLQLLPELMIDSYSLSNRQFLLISPPTVKGDVYRMRNRRITLKPYGNVPSSTLVGMGEEMRQIKGGTIWTFASKVICQWTLEGGASASTVFKAGLPVKVFDHAISQAQKSKIPIIIIVCPGAEDWVANLTPGVEIWDLARLLKELCGV